MDGVLVTSPIAEILVNLSVRHFRFISTNRSYLIKKSAPRIGLETFAIVKFHGKLRLRPKLRISDLLPNVSIIVLFAAYSLFIEGINFLLRGGGITDISAPVSTRKENLLSLSVIKNRQVFLSESSVEARIRPSGFPEWY